MVAYAVLAILWLLEYIRYMAQFVIMVGVSTFYFSTTEERVGKADLYNGLRMALFKHPGSIAFGALIMGIVEVFRWTFIYFLRYVDER